MRILRFDSVGGASGDMILAALIDAGADIDALRQAIAGLGLGPVAIHVEQTADRGLAGTRVRVDVPPETDQPHRHLADILDLIDNSSVAPRARELSRRVFERLADAEAAVHNTTPDRIHFHEVGAVDSIVDIVGACVGLVLLDIDAVEVSALPVGTGTTTCAHGILPLPVPAVAALLREQAVVTTDEPFELVTPTGAALLTCWRDTCPVPKARGAACTLLRTGYGIGHRALSGRANVLRASVLETREAPNDSPTSCIVLECNLDDTLPELVGSLMKRLMALGVLDVFSTPVFMKKQRPGIQVTVLCTAAVRDAAIDTIFGETTTFGIREYRVERTVLARRVDTVNTVYGPVRVKIGTWRGRDVTRAPEYEDCARLAEQHCVPTRRIYEAALHVALDNGL
jgi:uncharacterized protein (TIGR00299 family) protein